ncbi:MAG: hypothetical protein IPK19_39560 [Chloroflexi bacterium]|nr:hypothetical protein [Chloroflexota bacterium]
MDDAQALYREGVLALKEQHDAARARQLLTQSLKLNPNNELAWWWLAQATDDPKRKLQCMDRLLKINPNNEKALNLRAKLQSASGPPASAPRLADPAPSAPAQPPPPPASPKRSIHDRLSQASLVHHDPDAEPAPSTPPRRAATFFDPSAEAAPPAPSPALVEQDEPVMDAAASREPSFLIDSMEAAALSVPGAPKAKDAKTKPKPSGGTGFYEDKRDLIQTEDLVLTGQSKTLNDKLTPQEEQQIAKHLAAADARFSSEDEEGAIEQYVYALQIQVDHPVAMQRAVRLLHQLKYTEDAQELLTRAIEAGTPSLAIYLTAIDVHKLLGNYSKVDALREQVVQMDSVDEATILKIIDSLLNDVQAGRAVELLEKALEKRPTSHDLLMKMGEMLEDQGRKPAAARYYEQAARVGKKGKRNQADKVMQAMTPVITDHERGSVVLALREAFGFTAAYLVMAWQDAGLNLLRLTPLHWLGVGLSLVGGYCVITAFSSPQQKGLAKFFGGQVPAAPEGGKYTQEVVVKPWEEDIAIPSGPLQDPTNLPILPSWARMLFALVGFAVLALAFYLVFGRAIALLINPVQPELPSILDFIDVE